MNWAGGQGFAQSFLGTLQGLTALERAQLQTAEIKEERDRRKAFRGVVSEEMGRVGELPQSSTGALRDATGVTPEPQMSAIPGAQTPSGALQEAAGVVPGATGAIGAQATAVPASTSPITRQDALMNIYQRGLAVDPDRAFDVVLKGMQLEDVLSTSADKKAFRKWRDGFNEQLTEAQNLAGLAETDPNGFMQGAKKFGVEIRPISIGGGKTAYEAYSGGQKVGQYSDLQSAAQDGMAAFTNRLLVQGAARFATTPDQFVSILSAADKLEIDRRKLKIDEDKAGREAASFPLQQELTRAQINQVKTATAGADLAQAEATEYRKIRSRILELLENPSAENQTELRQLARRAGILNPKEVLVTKAYTDPTTGIAQTITTNVFTGEVQQSAREAGVAPPEVMAAARSGTNPVTGKPFTPAEIAEFQRKYPGTPWPGQQGAPSQTGGRTSALQDARPSPAATIRQAQGLPPRIPEPPPKEVTRTAGRGGGTIRTPNPAYDAWEKQYGEAYRAQQR